MSLILKVFFSDNKISIKDIYTNNFNKYLNIIINIGN